MRRTNIMFKLNIHSIIDVITNSSTVIYTYQNNIKEAKELLQEILDLMGEDKKVNDLFNITTFLDDIEYYTNYLEELEEDDVELPENYPTEGWKEQKKYIENIIEKVLEEEMDKPDWMKTAEDHEDWSGYTYPTSLYISSKEEKYNTLIEKALAFLNSPDHEAFRDG